jgi:NAD(P)-dependent dehydrogenase (short-subunit alcohol dehydrogenase family)
MNLLPKGEKISAFEYQQVRKRVRNNVIGFRIPSTLSNRPLDRGSISFIKLFLQVLIIMADALHPKFAEQDLAKEPKKNIVISGSARGIGRCLARTFLQKGNRVFLIDFDEEELTHTVNVHLKQYSERVSSSLCNIRNVNEVRSTVAKAAKFFNNQIDVLINNGGIATPYWRDGKTMEDPLTIEEWQAMIETNLTGPFVMSQACIPYMKVATQDIPHMVSSKAGPCIILVGSFRAHQSDPNQEGYASTKAGQLGLMHSST